VISVLTISVLTSTTSESAVERNEGDRVEKRKRERFKWSEDMHITLIECSRDYEVQCEFRGIDFYADKTVQYEWLRKEMAKRHEENQSYFSLRSTRLVLAMTNLFSPIKDD
jgi:hypothetical protein